MIPVNAHRHVARWTPGAPAAERLPVLTERVYHRLEVDPMFAGDLASFLRTDIATIEKALAPLITDGEVEFIWVHHIRDLWRKKYNVARTRKAG